jgi:hypothetical protein
VEWRLASPTRQRAVRRASGPNVSFTAMLLLLVIKAATARTASVSALRARVVQLSSQSLSSGSEGMPGLKLGSESPTKNPRDNDKRR